MALVAIRFEVTSLNLDLIVFSVSVLIGEDIWMFFVFPVQEFPCFSRLISPPSGFYSWLCFGHLIYSL